MGGAYRRLVAATRTARVYTMPDEPEPTQYFLLLHLLEPLGYPDTAGISADPAEGFEMSGRIRPRPGWPNRENPNLLQRAERTTRHTSATNLPPPTWASTSAPSQLPASSACSTLFCGCLFAIIQEDEMGGVKLRGRGLTTPPSWLRMCQPTMWWAITWTWPRICADRANEYRSGAMTSSTPTASDRSRTRPTVAHCDVLWGGRRTLRG